MNFLLASKEILQNSYETWYKLLIKFLETYYQIRTNFYQILKNFLLDS
jgi:hypothetical protein